MVPRLKTHHPYGPRDPPSKVRLDPESLHKEFPMTFQEGGSGSIGHVTTCDAVRVLEGVLGVVSLEVDLVAVPLVHGCTVFTHC